MCSGTTSFELARRVGNTGRVVGIDVSTPMLGVGRQRLSSSDISNLTFENKDAAAHQFRIGEFDRVFSRFGVMFFVEPVSAFSNIRRSITGDGGLAFVCWEEATKSQWIDVPLGVVLEHAPKPPTADPYAPGPMAFADPDYVRTILAGAGFLNLEINELQTRIPIATDVPVFVQKLLEVGPVSRLLGDASDDAMRSIREVLRDAISGCQTEHGVMMGSRTWIVTATP
ncbi:MAG: SAM-dependent methyltransferase [Gammaproteobacteria bacterium]|jgi:SAM-dependent methyltransferase